MLSLSVADAAERIYHTVMALVPKAEKTERTKGPSFAYDEVVEMQRRSL